GNACSSSSWYRVSPCPSVPRLGAIRISRRISGERTMRGYQRLAGAAVLLLLVAQGRVHGEAVDAPDTPFSSGGQLAHKKIAELRSVSEQSGGCFNEPDCEETPIVASSLQSETTIDVDSSGQHVVIGFNDFRGFSTNPATVPLSISGFMYSD